MDFRPIDYGARSFQQSVTVDQINAMCRRMSIDAVGAVELSGGKYNNTYRVDVREGRSVILRVAPEPAVQYRSERQLLRNEHASLPFFAPVAALMPRTIGVDFTHDTLGRDYIFQTLLGGVPAHEGLAGYEDSTRSSFYRDMGRIARTIHGVEGAYFGTICGVHFARWSDAVVASLEDIAADIESVELDASDIRAMAAEDPSVLDEITEPRLLHGDLWNVNVMIDPDAAYPTISGIFDWDRTLWGDPLADWTIFMATRRHTPERNAFWDAYGPLPTTPEAQQRMLFYRARHIGAIRLERHRLGDTGRIPETYDEMALLLTHSRP